MTQRGTAFMAAFKQARDNESRLHALTGSRPFVLELIESDRYEIAVPLVEEALKVARRLRNREIIVSVADAQDHVEALAKEYQLIQPDLEQLTEDPADPAANLAVGRFYAIYKRDWEVAISHLTRSEDSVLQPLAEKERQPSPQPLELGNGWWDLADLRSDEEQEAFRERAAHWYSKAWGKAEPLDRRRIENRLAEVKAAPVDLSQWRVRCWHGWWKPYHADKMEIAVNGSEILARNTTGVHNFAQLRYDANLAGDFYLTCEIAGDVRSVGVGDVSSRDASVSRVMDASLDWSRVVIKRTDSKISMTINGEEQTKLSRFNASDSIHCQFMVTTRSKKAVGVRNLILLE